MFDIVQGRHLVFNILDYNQPLYDPSNAAT